MPMTPHSHYSSSLAVATYDAFFGTDEWGDIAFYLDFARQFRGPILDLGTGTGRILIPLAVAGSEVVGLDPSAAMLRMAAAKLTAASKVTGRVRLVQGDMTDFALEQRFPLVIVSGRSFQHLAEPERQRQALNCVRRHASANGHLIVHLFDPRIEMLAQYSSGSVGEEPRIARHPTSGNLVRRTVVGRQCDPDRQLLFEAVLFEEIDDEGRVVSSEETTWAARWSLRREMAYLFELCGFKVIKLHSDFVCSPYTHGREQVWVVQPT